MKGAVVGATQWSAGLAARFRLLQASFADDPPEMRKRTLSEELERALKDVALGKRKEYIETLAAEFPAPEPVGLNHAAEQKADLPTARDDPANLVERLLTLIGTMPAAQTELITGQLAQAGLLASGASAKLDVPEDLKERIQKLAPGRHLDHARALRILDMLIEFVWSLDQLVWQVWKNIAPRSLIHHETGRYSDFRKTLAPYLTGDSEVSTEQIKQIVNKTRKLVSGLMAAMGSVGEIHGHKFLDRLSPDAIRKKAEADPGVFESIEKKCWRKYTTVFGELNEAAIEKEIFDAIKKYTEKLILGTDAAKTSEE